MTTGLFQRHYPRPGTSPGRIHGHADGVRPTLHVISFDADRLDEVGPADVEQAVSCVVPGRTVWIDVQGLGDGGVVKELCDRLGFHPLAIADVVHVGQRPKIESYGEELFVVLRMATARASGEPHWEQVSLFVREDLVVTFQERQGDCLDRLRERLRGGRRQIRTSGGAYLAVMVVDAIVDGYFPVLDAYAERLERLEEQVFSDPHHALLEASYRIRRELVVFRRALMPLREALGGVLRDPDSQLPATVHPYVRDVSDHLHEIGDLVESYRELANTISDVYLTSVTHRTNEIVRTLTVVSTIFIPLTFLAGIYGMNFDTGRTGNMPELGWSYGYVGFWAVALLVAGSLLLLFRRTGWLGRR